MELCQPFEKRATVFQDEVLPIIKKQAMDGVIGMSAQMIDTVS